LFKAWGSLRNLPREIWIIFVTTLINRAGTMVLPFLILYLTEVLKFSSARAGFVLTMYGTGALIAAPLSGWLCDRYGTVIIMKASLFLSGLLTLLFPLAHTFLTVIIAVITLAIATEMFRPASLAVVSQIVEPAQRKTAFAVSRLAINLGMSVGPALGGVLASISFFSLFLINASSSLVAGVVLLLSKLKIMAPASQTHMEPDKKELKSAFWDKHLLYFLIAVIPIMFVFFQHLVTMPLFFVKELRLSPAVYGLMFTVNTLLIVFLEVPLNIATSHWSYRRTLVLGTLLCSLGYGSFALTTGFWSVMIAVVIWTFGEMILFPGMSAYVAHIAPPDRQGGYMGLFTMAFALSFALAPWIGTQMYQALGGHLFWLAIFIIGSISVLMSAFLPSRAQTAVQPNSGVA
jgi:MFS family permease